MNISNLRIEDTIDYVLQSDPETGVVQKINGNTPENLVVSGFTINGPFRYTLGDQVNGYVLTIIDGVAVWQPSNNGSSGSFGSSGTSGVTGISGSSGTSGVTGISGSSGTSGIRGTSGSSGANGANTIPLYQVTYSGFSDRITAGALIEGGYYEITDYKTYYDQPNFDNLGNAITTGNYKQSDTVEPIIVFALDGNKISTDAYQAAYPKDKIKYDWTYNLTEVTNSPAKGRIIERIDEFNNRTDYDHRNILFKRYVNYVADYNNQYPGVINMTGSGNGNIVGTGTRFTQNLSVGDVIYIGNINREFKVTQIDSNTRMTVSGKTYSNTNSSLYYGTYPFNLSYKENNVDTNFTEHLTFTYNTNTYINNYIGNYGNLRTWGSNSFYLPNNVFTGGGGGNSYINNTLGDYSYNNTFYADCSNNVIGSYFYNNTCDDNFNNNVITTRFYNNYISASFQHNTTGYDFYNNIITGSDFYRNQIGTQFYSNKIFGTFHGNQIGNYFQSNTIRGRFQDNKIYDGFISNTIPLDFRYNEIKYAVSNVNFTSENKQLISVEIVSGGGSIPNGDYQNCFGVSSADGTGATFQINVVGGTVVGTSVTSRGFDYTIGEIITIAGSQLNSNVDLELIATDVSPEAMVVGDYNCTISKDRIGSLVISTVDNGVFYTNTNIYGQWF